jgi:hypothetical protein
LGRVGYPMGQRGTAGRQRGGHQVKARTEQTAGSGAAWRSRHFLARGYGISETRVPLKES